MKGTKKYHLLNGGFELLNGKTKHGFMQKLRKIIAILLISALQCWITKFLNLAK
jgi:hypothetical protein